MAIYRDYKLDSVGDLLIENGSFVIIEDQDVLKQQLETNLLLVKKDWFLNFDEGINLFGNDSGILGSTKLTAEDESQFQIACTKIDGIEQILDFNYTIENNLLTVTIKTLSVFGEIRTAVEIPV